VAKVSGPDRAVLAAFGIDETALLGAGGEASVFALDEHRVLRVLHAALPDHVLDGRRALLDAIAGGDLAVPEVLEHLEVAGRTVVVERRLPGRNALEVLGEPGTDRAALVRDHLDVVARIAELPCPTDSFGELWGDFALGAGSFRAWAVARLGASLRIGGATYRHLDPTRLTDDLVDALAEPEPASPRLVHLDAFLGNLLADGGRISAVLDFGPMTIGGPRDLDPAVAIAYLAPEITPTATDGDRAVARTWAAERGLSDLLAPAERWMAAYWIAAADDEALQRWCRRVLFDR
jgi:aminoglycoside phosphotransferase (APT) family kinase protein